MKVKIGIMEPNSENIKPGFPGESSHPNKTQVGAMKQDQEFAEKVMLCLDDINKSDPLHYRRTALESASSYQHSSVTIQDIRDIARLQDVLSAQDFSSHRRILGPFIVLFKRITFRFFRKWLRISLGKQLELNQRLLNLAIAVHVLENKVSNLEKSIQGRK